MYCRSKYNNTFNILSYFVLYKVCTCTYSYMSMYNYRQETRQS